MKQHWTHIELVKYWTLSQDEIRVINTKSNGTCDSGNECHKTVITKGFEQGIENRTSKYFIS